MDALKTLLLEGNFYILHQALWVRTAQGDKAVEPELEALVGRQVRLAVMHVPPDGVQADRWGGGSCNYQEAGFCPAGHHENPGKVLVFTGDGVLQKEDRGWVLHQFSGGIQDVPLRLMAGHYGRIVGATTDAVEKMREKLSTMDPTHQVEALSAQAGGLRDLLDQLRKTTGN